MIVELAIASGITYVWNYINNRNEIKFKDKFTDIMKETGIKNKGEQTFKVYKIIPVSYGYKACIKIPSGLSLEHLNSKLNILEDNLNGIIELEKDKFKPHITMRIVDKDIDMFKFQPVKCPSHKIYIGKDFKGQDYFLDLNKDPHVLIGGTTGTGKSFLLASILTNLMYNSSKDIEIYLSQIVKGEIGAFAECQPVKFVAYNMVEVLISLNKVCEMLDKRSELFNKHGIKNIAQWNKHFPTRHMKRIIYVLEELSFFINTNVWDYVLEIVKAGRSVGIHCLGLLQRSTATNLPPDVKAQMTRITFRQKSSIDSTNIINCPDAKELKERECLVDSNNGLVRIKVPWIDEDYVLLNKYVNEIRVPTDEEKQEVTNIIKEDDKVLLIEEPTIIDVEEEDIKPVVKKKQRKGVIDLSEVDNNANSKR